MKSSEFSSRIDGLDTLRSCAILLVLMFHYMVFVSGQASFGLLSEIGWIGVDLFFVLSGYLIANQIFSAMNKEAGFSLGKFYARRALRTLPNFYVVLAIYFLFPVEAGGKALTPLWKFLTFTQNFDLKPGTAFSHAWSLSIEEQFYVALPLLAVVCISVLKSYRLMWVVVIAAMGAAALTRLWMWQGIGDDTGAYYVHIYYSTWCRFDELLPGVALALLKNFHGDWWRKLTRHGQVSLICGSLLTAFAIYLFVVHHSVPGVGFNVWVTSLGYTLLSGGFALLCLSALSPTSYLSRWRIPGAASLALWSYALYLIHKPLMNMMKPLFIAREWDLNSLSAIAIMFSASAVAAFVMFKLVETPFMRLRERYLS
ncbi:MAG: acyltransferase [Burkholderiales bacterium]|nr:acyltransferase [Burkholderiales bacterium]